MNHPLSVDTRHVWSLALRELLGANEASLCWLNEIVEQLLDTGVGAVEVCSDGPTTWHYVPVPADISTGDDEDLLVVEITRANDVALVSVRPAFCGTEPTTDWALVEVSS